MIFEAANTVKLAVVTAVLISVRFTMLILVWLFRGVVELFLVYAPFVLAAVLTVSARVIFGLSFNFANVNVLPLLFGLGVASGNHLVMGERSEKKAAN